MLKLNVGLTQKVGQANYGSRGTSGNLELELDSKLVGDAERLKDRIRQLFQLAQTSVAEQLGDAEAITVRPVATDHGADRENGQANHHGNDNSRDNGLSSNKGHHRPRETGHPATASQARAIYAIANRQGIELADKLRANFGVDSPEQLTIREASRLIDDLNGKDSREPVGGRR
jgi:hypothetical protein